MSLAPSLHFDLARQISWALKLFVPDLRVRVCLIGHCRQSVRPRSIQIEKVEVEET